MATFYEEAGKQKALKFQFLIKNLSLEFIQRYICFHSIRLVNLIEIWASNNHNC